MFPHGCHCQLLLSVLLQNFKEIQVNLLDWFGRIKLFVFSSSADYGPARGGNNFNYPYNGADNSPTSYDNKIHVSEIYGNSTCKAFFNRLNPGLF